MKNYFVTLIYFVELTKKSHAQSDITIIHQYRYWFVMSPYLFSGDKDDGSDTIHNVVFIT